MNGEAFNTTVTGYLMLLFVLLGWVFEYKGDKLVYSAKGVEWKMSTFDSPEIAIASINAYKRYGEAIKRIIVFASAVLLTGCMASESVQQRAPVFVAETTKSAEVYSNCVHERWAELTVGAERFTRPNGFRVRNYAGGLLDVTGTATGAHIKMREPPLSARSPEDAAKACL